MLVPSALSHGDGRSQDDVVSSHRLNQLNLPSQLGSTSNVHTAVYLLALTLANCVKRLNRRLKERMGKPPGQSYGMSSAVMAHTMLSVTQHK